MEYSHSYAAQQKLHMKIKRAQSVLNREHGVGVCRQRGVWFSNCFKSLKISTAGNNEVGEKHREEEVSQITVVKSP